VSGREEKEGEKKLLVEKGRERKRGNKGNRGKEERKIE